MSDKDIMGMLEKKPAQQGVQPTPESGRDLPVESNDSVGSAPAISG